MSILFAGCLLGLGGLNDAWAQTPVRTPQLSPYPSAAATGKAATPDEAALALGLSTDSVVVSFAGDPNGYAALSTGASGFPVEGDAHLLLTTGFSSNALTANTGGGLSGVHNVDLRSVTPGPGGGNDLVQMTLDLLVPDGAQSVSFNFKFLSEEFPEFVGLVFNDAFVVELNGSTFSVEANGVISAPNNVVFDEQGNLVSVNTTGALSLTGDDPEITDELEGPPLTGTTYDGGTAVLSTTIPLEGHVVDGRIRLIFSLFDVGDDSFDSAVFIDRVRFSGADGGGTGVADLVPPECTGSFDGPFYGSVSDFLNTDPTNRGVGSVRLAAGSENLAIDVAPFEPGAERVSFRVDWTDASGVQAGIGRVIGTDLAGNTCSLSILFPTAPIALIEPPTNVGPSAATLRAFVDPNGAETSVTFELLAATRSASRTISLDAPLAPDTPAGIVEVEATGLSAASTYRYRAVVTSAEGTASTEERSFETPSAIQVAPLGLAFGTQQTGALSAPRTVTLTNGQASPLTIAGVQVEPAAFSLTGDTGEQVLSAGATRTLQIAFTPSADTEFTGVLTVTSDGGTVTVPLSGRGLSFTVTASEEARAGDEVALSVDIPSTFSPQERVLCYRSGGRVAYSCINLVPSAGSTSTLYQGAIPPAATTERGVEYFFRFVETDDAGFTSTLTFPALNPELNPEQLRVRFDELVAPGLFTPSAYRMVSVPVLADDLTLGRLLWDDYGAYDERLWRIVSWEPAEEVYVELPERDVEVAPGESVWLITRDGTPFDVGGGVSWPLRSQAVEIVLEPGWTQIASPFPFAVAWNDVLAQNEIEPGVVEGPFGYDGVGFVPNQPVLAPWEGYFVLNPTGRPLSLNVPPIEAGASSSAGPASARAASGRAASTTDDAFSMTLTVMLADGRQDPYNTVGTHPDAADTRDVFDVSEPPPVGPHVRLSIVDGDRRLARSVKSTGGDGQVWDLEVVTSEKRRDPLTATLRLVPDGPLPPGATLYLLDVDAEAAIPVASQRAVVALDAGTAPRRLRLIVGTADFAKSVSRGIGLTPAATDLLPGYPNPIRTSAVIPYSLAETADVDISVYDLLGRRVHRLVRTTHAPGTYQAVWNGQNDFGRPVASGVYFLRMTAGDFSRTQKLVVVR